ncbi:translation initiation factor 2 [Streptomyces sp. NPDC090442]|uniref:translation initiation factor 2 n=1 Tax=Streptomyces sp. NPDC090442 TaxID=3365962 RepID=UPI00381B1712
MHADQAGSGQRAAGSKSVLFAVRSAVALHRLLDALPVFAGDPRIRRHFTLVPGSAFAAEALGALDGAGARLVPWDDAVRTSYDLVLAASPKGDLDRLRGPLVLLPHGAGFGKSLPGEGSADSASGLDATFLIRDGVPLADLHALAHGAQVAALTERCPAAAPRAAVVGDPTLDRLLASRGRRERYRAALGTGGRRLVVLTSTWGPESLLARHPGLPARLVAELPQDAYQVALVLHPNDHSETGAQDLAEWLAPAVAGGLLVPRPYEEWAAVLVAADAVLTDHGSTALYAAALDRPLLAVCDGGTELLPGSPMARLLAAVPAFRSPDDLDAAVARHRPGSVRALADGAFAERGRALERLRAAVYGRLGLSPPAAPAEPRLLPPPRRTAPAPVAWAVRTTVTGTTVTVERHPPGGDGPLGHLAVEEDAASVRHARSAAVLLRRARPGSGDTAWTAGGWTTHALARYPGRRTAAVLLAADRCVLRRPGGAPLSVRIAAREAAGRVHRPDPAAVVSAVHAWLARSGTEAAWPVTLICRIGGRSYRVRLAPATEDEAALEV